MTAEELNFKEQDYRHLRFNVMALPSSADIVKSIREFSLSPEFNVTINHTEEDKPSRIVDKNKAIRYMVLVYDPQSPLKPRLLDDVKVRQAAATISGFKPSDKGKFPAEIDSIMRGMNSTFNAMLIRYLRFFNSPTYSMMVTTQQAFYNKLLAVIDTEAETGKKKGLEAEKIRGELMKQADELLQNLNAYSTQLLRSDKNPFLQEDLYAIVDEEARSLNLSPEYMSRSN